MIKISKQNNSLIVEGIENVFYPNNGDNSYPLNSLIVVTDNSDMATFRSVATNDVLFSGLIKDITINGESVTKDNIIQKFDAISNSSTGGGAVDAYTKEEADTKFATKTELSNVQTVANDADTKVDALTPRVENVETSLGNKQDTLVSGTNIKTINNQSILGEGNIEISGGEVDLTNYYTKPEADGKFATITGFNEQSADISALQTAMDGKQPTLVSGTNIKTINGESVLGEGNIEVAKKTDIPSTDNLATKDELTAVETVANNADAKADAATSRVESVETALNNKQDTLVSGTNIKTINSESILGTGDIQINGVSEEQAQEIAKIPTLETEIAQKANVSDVPTVQTNFNGTNKKYIYSEGNIDNNNKTVVSNIVNVNDNPDTVKLGIYEWGGSMGKVIKLPSATTTLAGVMSAADKAKLDSIPETIPSQSEIDGIAADVSALQTAMDGKQPTLVSGTNIKTINNQSILGEGNLEITGGDVDLTNYYTKTETDTKLDTKQNTLVSGTNIKTINSQSILGEGNIVIEGGGSTPVKHTINLGTNDPGKAYNETGNGTIFLSLTVDQYDIDSINVNDEVELTWENSGKTVKSIVKEGYFTSDGQKLKYITTSFKIEDGDFEVRNVVFYNNTAIYVLPIVAPTENTTSPTVYCVKGVTDNQTTKWDNAAKLNNYYDYKIGTQYTIPSIDNNFKGIVYRNNMMGTKVDITFNRYTQFKAARSLAEAITYTIGKSTTTGRPLIQAPDNGNNVTINNDGSWTIPTTGSENSNQMYYRSVIYANGEIIKNAGVNDGVTFHVGDRIQVTNEYFPGAGLFRDFINAFDSTKINISYEGIINTDATNQLLNQFNGNSYNIRSEANEWTGIQEEYDALTTKDNNTIYYVTE